MSHRLPSGLRLTGPALALSAAFAGGCGSEEPSTPSPSTGGQVATTGGSGGTLQATGGSAAIPSGGSAGEGGAAPERWVWPDPRGPENSSEFLREHHDELESLEPRVLVLDVVEREGLTPISELVDGLVAAFGEMSRYQGYKDEDAKPFLNYQIDKIVDLRDPNGAEYPDFWPPQTASGFDVGELFSEAFAARFGYTDPEDASRSLTLCELFEKGIINELWIAADSSSRNIFENQSRMQRYDETLEKIPDSFDGCTNGCYYDPLSRVSCAVTVKMQEINKSRGVGCGTHAAGHMMENLKNSNPYWARETARFMGFDLSERHGLSNTDLYACSYEAGLCVDRPSPERMVSSERWPGAAFDIDDWGQACGSVHFPPNGRSQYDYYSSVMGLTSCENFGLENGPGGLDLTTSFNSDLTEEMEALHGDCGGGWVVYWGQSFPGFENQAKDVNGAPMKNWWPFLFY